LAYYFELKQENPNSKRIREVVVNRRVFDGRGKEKMRKTEETAGGGKKGTWGIFEFKRLGSDDRCTVGTRAS